jgi:hypothetical protein
MDELDVVDETQYTEEEVFILEAEHELKLLTQECAYCSRTGVEFVEGDVSWYCEVHK